MRRPVKPFVTEYKAPNRRPPQPVGGPSRGLTDDFGQSVATKDIFSRNSIDPGNQGEDAYEAALRAADALFAPSPKKSSSPVPASRDVFAAQPTASEFEDDVEAKSGGRVLRAMDEAPVVDFAAMEIEHAPKKRGRKPGSKNKPKVLSTIQPSVVPQAPAYSHDDHDDEDEGLFEDATDVIATAEPEPARVSVRRAPMQDEPRNAPYAWVRKKLAPGEQWKRRLPKVCW